MAGLALFPLLAMTIWWMLPPLAIAGAVSRIASVVSRIALVVYMPLYIAVDAVLGIGSGILIGYRNGLASADRAGADGALTFLFYEGSAIDWIDPSASLAWKIAAIAAAVAAWRNYGWRVSVPLAAVGWLLATSHYPPEGILAGLALGIAVSQYLMLERRAGAAAIQPAEELTRTQ